MKRNSTSSTLPATATHLVLPEQLAEQATEAVRELLAEAAAANTTRSYAAALRYWAGWHQGRYEGRQGIITYRARTDLSG